MSYDGHLGFGLLGDYDALPELEAIALDLQSAIDSLGRAALRRASPTAGRATRERQPRGSTARSSLPRPRHASLSEASNWRTAQRAPHGADQRRATLAARSSARSQRANGCCWTQHGTRRRDGEAPAAGADAGAAGADTIRDAPGALPAERHRRRHRGQRRAHPRGHARGRARRAPSSCCSPSSRSPATRPRICCSRSTSSPTPPPRCSELAAEAHGLVAVVGFPERAEDVYNAAAVLADGAVHAIYRKVYLPNYGVFDEQRYFQAGPAGAVIDIGARARRADRVRGHLGARAARQRGGLAGATLILNISASPYHAGKGAERERMFAQRARENVACVAFCALVGGQDELVFDGHSCVLDHTGATIARAAQFREELLVCDVDLEAAAAARLRDPSQRPAARRSERRAEVLPALPAPAPAPQASPGASRRASGRAARAGGGRGLRRAHARPARLRPQERLPARRARALRRDRLGARRLPGRRRARPRARERRDHALALLLERHPGRRARARRSARGAHPRAGHRARHGRLRAGAPRPSSPTARPTSPRRTCRRASAATC